MSDYPKYDGNSNTRATRAEFVIGIECEKKQMARPSHPKTFF